MTYIIASISLGILYLIVLVALCVLLIIFCYKQKNGKARLSAANKNKKNVVKKSTDTLVS